MYVKYTIVSIVSIWDMGDIGMGKLGQDPCGHIIERIL
jgi:hypothetical protein